jgi:hypothetical protein
MIDWPQVLANAVWIGGAALALATFSYASWLASMRDERLRDTLQLLLRGAAVLVCLGLGLTANRLLETVLWLALAALSVAAFISLWRTMRTQRKP